ncbi:GSCFA family protein [Pseudovibrio denitrificans]|uniref:GSCFA family protein n=1 Tax=Pseudovibrio denitrificans TaxID=258256 RepID=A0A1I7CTK4_9HYPH|nr:GSCFA domain-containing protein [Pseudovibrio denitrificans]SFU02750.1 GSCFA family protein [Pseudovibrio denitrificans]
MPLQVIPAREAIEVRKSNPAAGWPNRGSANRFEPIARPRIEASFKLEPRSRIFTVGSCFARNVERNLEQEGFRLPAKELLKQPEFAGVQVRVLNSYGTPSIFNEFSWALDPLNPYDYGKNICKVGEGRYVDLHIASGTRPCARSTVEARRRAVTEMYRTVTTSHTVIITLGLSEVWYDTVSSNYLNVTPLPVLLRTEPERFQLHVLSHNELLSYLVRTIELLNLHCEATPNILISVSPVPLGQTHRQLDVAVANTYSKSVLRAVAEEAVCSFDNVFYFPSFEAVTLTDRKLAWHDDQIHVTDRLVEEQVSRMIDTFMRRETDNLTRNQLLEILIGKPKIKELNRLFDAHGSVIKSDLELLKEYTRGLVRHKQYSSALEFFELIPEDADSIVIHIRTLRMLQQYKQAFDLVRKHFPAGSRNIHLWQELVALYVDQGEISEAYAHIEKWVRVFPARSDIVYRRSARLFAPQYPEHARELYLKAIEFNPEDSIAPAELKKLDKSKRPNFSGTAYGATRQQQAPNLPPNPAAGRSAFRTLTGFFTRVAPRLIFPRGNGR